MTKPADRSFAAPFPAARLRKTLTCYGAILLFCVLATGCATHATLSGVDATHFLHDDAFPGSTDYAVESRQEVFGLDREAREWLDNNITPIKDVHERGYTLLDAVFGRAAMNLAYAGNANTTASETFRNRIANCLSMSILVHAMAEYAGFEAAFQEVDIPAYWERRDNYSLLSRHINVRLLLTTRNSSTLFVRQTELEVDFLSPAGVSRSTWIIPESRVLAMFYNNKGIDALLAGRHDIAYAYLKAALLQDPALDMVLANLGLLYQANGHLQWAEENYRQAYRLDETNPVSAEHLAVLLKATGRQDEADSILAGLERRRQDNPYYHYILGEEAYDAGDLQAAIRHYKKAIALQPDADEFHFGLAKSYLRLGDNEMAEAYLQRAAHYADQANMKQRYRNKLAALSRL